MQSDERGAETEKNGDENQRSRMDNNRPLCERGQCEKIVKETHQQKILKKKRRFIHQKLTQMTERGASVHPASATTILSAGKMDQRNIKTNIAGVYPVSRQIQRLAAGTNINTETEPAHNI